MQASWEGAANSCYNDQQMRITEKYYWRLKQLAHVILHCKANINRNKQSLTNGNPLELLHRYYCIFSVMQMITVRFVALKSWMIRPFTLKGKCSEATF